MAGRGKPSLTRSLSVVAILGVLALATWAGWRAAAAADQRRREEARREAEAAAAEAAAEAARPSFTARLEPGAAVDQGDYVVVIVESTERRVITAVEASVFDGKLPLYEFAEPAGVCTVGEAQTGGVTQTGPVAQTGGAAPPGQVYYSSFAVGSARKAGEYAVSLTVTDSRGVVKTEDLPFTVREKKFEVQRMTVTGKNAALASDSSAWEYDARMVSAAKAHPTAKPLWDGNFIKPLEGEISTEFGQVRYVNGVLTSRHSGLDLEAPMGAVIHAVNSGLVVFVGPLKISGNTVIIDHGLGFFSSYNHMSKFSVKEGDMVAKGQEIGRVGSTGFSTSAHLHWTMTVGLTSVNPWLFVGGQPPLPFVGYADAGE